MDNVDFNAENERGLLVALRRESEDWTTDCLPPERIIALAEGALPEAEATFQMAHVALCPRCRREYAETLELIQLSAETLALEAASEPPAILAPKLTLVQVAEEPAKPAPIAASSVAPEPRRSFLRSWGGIGAGFGLGAVAASVALFLTYTNPSRVQQSQLASNLQERERQIARLEQDKRTLAADLEAQQRRATDERKPLAGKIERLDAQVKEQGVQIARLETEASALRDMPLPQAEWRVLRAESIVRGAGSGSDPSLAIALLSPQETALLDTTPMLECRPVAGASDYQISLEIEGSNEEIPAPKRIAPTRWQVTTPLAPGKVYKWAVSAQRGGERIRSQVVPFYVLSAAQRQEVETARQRYAKNPLALGAVYARLGLRTEAMEQFRTLLQTDPNHAVAKRWLQELARQTQR